MHQFLLRLIKNDIVKGSTRRVANLIIVSERVANLYRHEEFKIIHLKCMVTTNNDTSTVKTI